MIRLVNEISSVGKIPYYKTHGVKEILYKSDLMDFEDALKEQGYKYKTDLLNPYFYIEHDNFLELIRYRHESEGSSIVHLWDHSRVLFEFYCENPQIEFECIKELIQISLNKTLIEKELKKLYEKG